MENIYVGSGDYIILQKKQPQKLVALLGTCVGVAIFDKKSKVGGICHILLPKPNDSSSVWQPKKYATTSLPLFVDELLQAGAVKENLEAVIAGGSLCAPFSTIDTILDIGGLNVESALQFMDRHKIPVSQSETGGCDTMSLIFDSTDCSVEVQYASKYIAPLHPDGFNSQAPSMQDIESAIESTKPIPQIALKLARIIKKENYNVSDVLNELNSDQVLCAKLIRYCNSAFFGLKGKIDSTQKAILLLGETHLLEAIIVSAVQSFFEQEQLGGYALVKGGLFKHSLCVANLSRIIAQTIQKEDEHTVYTAGLLHDIGKIVLDTYVAKAQYIFYSTKEEPTKDMIQLEREVFKCDHQMVGRTLAEKWLLPDNIAEVISCHHAPDKATEAQSLTHIVSIANILTPFFMAGVGLDRINTDTLTGSLSFLGLKESDLPSIIEQVSWDKIMYA